MKRFLISGLLIALCCLVLPAMGATYTLYADQDIPVGYVDVWNTGPTMFVDFVITAPGWKIAQEHVAVGTALSQIPQAKGNPIPGKFPYSAIFDPPVVDPPPIQIGVTPGVPLYIAAHVSLVHMIDGCTETVWVIGDVESFSCGPENTLLSCYMDEFNVIGALPCGLNYNPYNPDLGPQYIPLQTPAFANPFIVGTNLTNEFPFMANAAHSYPGGLTYGTDFNVTWNGALPFGGKLTFSWSPGASGNERKVISGNGITTTTFGPYTGYVASGAGWFMNTYRLVENTANIAPLAAGDHMIRFQHTTGDGTFWDWVKLERPCFTTETGWGDGEDFLGNNWATYFNYIPV
jgi:hypothetical protein